METANEQRRAMARVLSRAAEVLEGRAKEIDDRVARRRKSRGDEDEIVARTLHGVVRQLRTWADLVLRSHGG